MTRQPKESSRTADAGVETSDPFDEGDSPCAGQVSSDERGRSVSESGTVDRVRMSARAARYRPHPSWRLRRFVGQRELGRRDHIPGPPPTHAAEPATRTAWLLSRSGLRRGRRPGRGPPGRTLMSTPSFPAGFGGRGPGGRGVEKRRWVLNDATLTVRADKYGFPRGEPTAQATERQAAGSSTPEPPRSDIFAPRRPTSNFKPATPSPCSPQEGEASESRQGSTTRKGNS
jgi:hypothetical protein